MVDFAGGLSPWRQHLMMELHGEARSRIKVLIWLCVARWGFELGRLARPLLHEWLRTLVI